MRTKIEWTDATWNPVTGCTKVSPACAHCYIERTPPMRMAGRRFVDGKIPVELHPDRLEAPLHWRKPRRVFVCSMGDLFHEDVPDEFIDQVFAVMTLANQHTFQVLTKRPERMQDFVRSWLMGLRSYAFKKVLPNVWLGVSVENQARADERIPLLLETPAAVRFISAEPLLGPLDLKPWLRAYFPISVQATSGSVIESGTANAGIPALDQVIVGGESAGPEHRRLVERCPSQKAGAHIHVRRYHDGGVACTGYRPKPEALEWVCDIQRQCQAAGVPFFFKQWGGPTPKAGGRLLDGRMWEEMPRQEVRA